MATEFLRFQPTSAANILLLNLPESLEAVEFDELNASMLHLLDGRAKQKWVVDLTEVSYMGSAMLGMLVNLRQKVKATGGRLVLCGMSPRLMDIFRTCCMERLFTIVKDQSIAVSSVH